MKTYTHYYRTHFGVNEDYCKRLTREINDLLIDQCVNALVEIKPAGYDTIQVISTADINLNNITVEGYNLVLDD